MPQASFPEKITSVTEKWLTRVLRAKAVLGNSEVTRFAASPLSGGYTSLVYRLEYWDEIMICMGQDTHTLVHTDPHLGQMFFPTAELPRFVLFDWQNPSKSWGAEDVVHPIVAELDVDQRREHEESLIDHYYDNLCRLGISDLTRERLGFQCKIILLWLYFTLFNLVVQPDLLQALNVIPWIYGTFSTT